MRKIPGHILPTYTEASKEDALFHYTSAAGLKGIFVSGEIWNTAYYCTNDETELETGKGVLEPFFRNETQKLIKKGDPRVKVFIAHGNDIRDTAKKFEDLLFSSIFDSLCAYITCFCKPSGEEDFYHGLLSQWRGYGNDGGYALQFSRKKLLTAINDANKAGKLNYYLQDVYYATDNPLKKEILSHKDIFIKSYLSHWDQINRPIAELITNKTWPNPIAGLLGGPLEKLLEYLVYTKNLHFSEERECRLGLIQLVQMCEGCLPVDYFNRNELLVPYIKTPISFFNILDCIEWVVIGPSPRLEARIKSVSQLIKQSGRDIKVRPSHIPFTKL